MPSIFNDDVRMKLEERVRLLRPDSCRQWGQMTPHQAICHMSDAFKMALGEKQVATLPQRFKPLVRVVALYLPLKWPQGGIETVPEAKQGVGGTPPAEFERDRAELLSLIRRFSTASPRERQPAHPILGRMRTHAWGRWGYRHVDHHLRQFGA